MGELIRVAVDAMGGDNAPAAIVDGAVQALKKRNDLKLFLVGQEDLIRAELKKYSDVPQDRISIVNTTEVIEMAEPPVAAIRTKKDSSMVVAMKLVKDGEADAFASAGSSGAVLVGAQLIVGRVKGIQRPPFAVIIPTGKGCSLLLDCGANVDARPDHMIQFAKLGSIYMENVMGIKNPTVGIVNIGAEEEKGNELVKETFPLLKERTDINFVGSVEARDIPAGGVDVLVTEAFAGNVVLKMFEGTAKLVFNSVKTAMMSSLKTKIGALLIKSALKKELSRYDSKQYGGAPVLGLKGLVVKMHGSSGADEVRNTILQCAVFTEQKITQKVEEYVAAERAAGKNKPE